MSWNVNYFITERARAERAADDLHGRMKSRIKLLEDAIDEKTTGTRVAGSHRAEMEECWELRGRVQGLLSQLKLLEEKRVHYDRPYYELYAAGLAAMGMLFYPRRHLKQEHQPASVKNNIHENSSVRENIEAPIVRKNAFGGRFSHFNTARGATPSARAQGLVPPSTPSGTFRRGLFSTHTKAFDKGAFSILAVSAFIFLTAEWRKTGEMLDICSHIEEDFMKNTVRYSSES